MAAQGEVYAAAHSSRGRWSLPEEKELRRAAHARHRLPLPPV